MGQFINKELNTPLMNALNRDSVVILPYQCELPKTCTNEYVGFDEHFHRTKALMLDGNYFAVFFTIPTVVYSGL